MQLVVWVTYGQWQWVTSHAREWGNQLTRGAGAVGGGGREREAEGAQDEGPVAMISLRAVGTSLDMSIMSGEIIFTRSEDVHLAGSNYGLQAYERRRSAHLQVEWGGEDNFPRHAW